MAIALPVGVLIGFVALALLVLGSGATSVHRPRPVDTFPVHSFRGWQAWSVVRLMDEARTWLFPLYSSTLTPTWLRSLGAKIGEGVEASTSACSRR